MAWLPGFEGLSTREAQLRLVAAMVAAGEPARAEATLAEALAPKFPECAAALLGFAAPTMNSIDTVGDRDGAADLVLVGVSAGALAGVINLISRREVNGTYVTLGAEAGSWNTAQLQGGIGLGDGYDYLSAGFHALSTDGYDMSADHRAVGVTSVGPGNNANDTEGSEIVTAYLRGGKEISPLFRVDAPARGKKPASKAYALDEGELIAILDKLRKENVREGAWSISRFKGLGEMNAEQLWDTTLNPDTRRLLPVQLGTMDFMQTEHLITKLMGKGEAAARRELMELHGDSVEVDV